MTADKLVMLVDDIPEYLDTMELNLPDGCRVLRALSAVEARAIAKREKLDVAVIDIRLSEDDRTNREGLDLLSWLQEETPRTKIIMISAYREFEYAAESLSLGAAYFLRKPIQPDEFRETVNQVLKCE